MIENNFVKKVIKAVTLGRKSHIYDRSIMHPERDWLLGVSVSLIILILGGLWSITNYKNLQEPVDENIVNFSAESTYKDVLVKDAIAKYRERMRQYNNLKAELVKTSPVVSEEVIKEEDTGTLASPEVETGAAVPEAVTPAPIEEVIELSL